MDRGFRVPVVTRGEECCNVLQFRVVCVARVRHLWCPNLSDLGLLMAATAWQVGPGGTMSCDHHGFVGRV